MGRVPNQASSSNAPCYKCSHPPPNCLLPPRPMGTRVSPQTRSPVLWVGLYARHPRPLRQKHRSTAEPPIGGEASTGTAAHPTESVPVSPSVITQKNRDKLMSRPAESFLGITGERIMNRAFQRSSVGDSVSAAAALCDRPPSHRFTASPLHRRLRRHRLTV